MSMRHRINAPRPVNAEHVREHFEGRGPTGSFWAGFFWAPFDRKTSYISTIILGFIMEIVGTMIFALFVNLARSVAISANVLLDGAVLGLVGGGTYWMVTGWRLHEKGGHNELPRHLSWSVSLAHFLTFHHTGLVILLIYWVAQTIGSLAAGGILYGIGSGALPTPAIANLNVTWGFEILGAGLIAFSHLYNQLLGGTIEKEDKRVRKGQKFASYARGFFTIVAYQYQSYSFDAVIYLAGLIGLCTSAGCPNATPFNNAPVFYLLVPFIGVVGAVVLYYLLLALYGVMGSVTREATFPGRRMKVTVEEEEAPEVPPREDAGRQISYRQTTASQLLDVKNQ